MANEIFISKLNEICKKVLLTFPCSKIYFTEKLGNRISYLTGQGQESFLPKQKIDITEKLICFYYSTSDFDETALKKFIIELLYHS